MARFCRSILLALLLGWTGLARAEDADHPVFRDAVADWLAGRDRPSLASLADLSRQGNTAAQTLLWAIGSDRFLQPPEIADLSFAERAAMFRPPASYGFRTWVEVAAREDGLALALSQARHVDDKPSALLALFSYGEPFRALQIMHAMAEAGQIGPVREVLALGLAPEDLAAGLEAYLDARVGARLGTPLEDGVRFLRAAPSRTSQAARMVWSPISMGDLRRNDDARALALSLARDVPGLTPLVTFCARHCPHSVASCSAVAASTIFTEPPFPFASPVETLIPTALYWQSARLEGDLLRRLPDLRATPGLLTEVDACFAPVVSALQRAHR